MLNFITWLTGIRTLKSENSINSRKDQLSIVLSPICRVVEFNHDTAQKIFRGLVKSHLLLFLNKTSDDFEGVTAMARKLAETPEFYQKVMFVTVDTDEDDHRRVIEYLGLKGERFPNMRIVQMKDDIEKYRPVKVSSTRH